MGWFAVLALIGLAVLIGLVVVALKAALKRQAAHTEPRHSSAPTAQTPTPLAPPPATLAPPEPLESLPGQSPLVGIAQIPAAEPANLPEPVPEPEPAAARTTPPQGKIRALVRYKKANGSSSEREVVLYSRVLKEGLLHAVNIREPGDGFTKKFLVTGLERVQLLESSPECSLDSPASIRAWIEENLPLKGERRAATKSKRDAGEQAAAVSKGAAKPAVAAVAQPLPMLLPDGAKGFAVFDLETTGLDTSACSIVEIALVCVDPSGRITETWETLLNPGCTIPAAATGVHNIGNRDVIQAPSFEDISALLAAKLDQHVLVAHNLRYDFPILERHFRAHSDLVIDLGVGICTLRGFGGDPAHANSKKLQHLCSFHGVAFDPRLAHTALGDVLPLAHALIKGMAHLQPSAAAVSVPRLQSSQASGQVLTRAMLAQESESSWIKSTLLLKPGLCFVTTSPPSMKTETPIRRAAAHAERLGLTKLERITKKNPPDFVLATSLSLETTKMAQARDRGIPVVLIEPLNQARSAQEVVDAWLAAEG